MELLVITARIVAPLAIIGLVVMQLVRKASAKKAAERNMSHALNQYLANAEEWTPETEDREKAA